MNRSRGGFLGRAWRTGFVALLALLGTGFSITGATLPAGFVETQVGSDLGGSPTAMAFAPDGRLFVCLQAGQLRVIKNGVLLPTPFLSLSVDPNGERGLLGIAFDPAFTVNHLVYVYYTVPSAPVHNRVSRFIANGDVAVSGSETVILELDNLSSATNHNGGAIHFGPDGKLYVAVGENATGANSQTLSNRLGKMLRINSDGTIPTDNPFYNVAVGNNRAIWALGLRNPFTFDFQSGTGRLFINDVGQSTWEEINDGIAGSNYGWPDTEGPTSDPRFRSPLFWYGHGSSNSTGCAITGGSFYNPIVPQFPASYVGKYFFADFCTGWIRLFDPASKTTTGFATGISSPVDLHVGPEGSLYYLARGSGGQIFKISATNSQLLNLSTRLRVQTGENVSIDGFIITGNVSKKVIVRGIGPSLQQFNVPGVLPDPVLELHGPNGSIILTNDNWKDTQQGQIEQSQLAPENDLESAIVATLAPGPYTVILRGKNSMTGVALVEVYDLDPVSTAQLGNVSGRGFVETGDNVLIGGLILGGAGGATTVITRAIGPSLADAEVMNPLSDPVLELRNGNGALVSTNDNWQDDSSQASQLVANNLAPLNNLESGIVATLAAGQYTAIVSGKNGNVGVALVEVYSVP